MTWLLVTTLLGCGSTPQETTATPATTPPAAETTSSPATTQPTAPTAATATVLPSQWSLGDAETSDVTTWSDAEKTALVHQSVKLAADGAWLGDAKCASKVEPADANVWDGAKCGVAAGSPVYSVEAADCGADKRLPPYFVAQGEKAAAFGDGITVCATRSAP